MGLIMHFLNNSPSPIKAGFTPNQLFLGEGAGEQVKHVDDFEYFVALKRDGKVRIIEPRNIDALKENLLTLRKAVQQKLKTAYTRTEYLRRKQRERTERK